MSKHLRAPERPRLPRKGVTVSNPHGLDNLATHCAKRKGLPTFWHERDVGGPFRLWDPFPVQAPDKAPETCTWSTRSEGGRNLLSRNLDGNQIAWKYRRCAGHANLLFRDGVKRQVGKCDCLLEFTTRPELSQSRARIWPQQHVPKRLKNSATRNSTARSQNRRLTICMA